MGKKKYTELPDGVEHVSTIISRVLRDIALSQFKRVLLELDRRKSISENMLKKEFSRFIGTKRA